VKCCANPHAPLNHSRRSTHDHSSTRLRHPPRLSSRLLLAQPRAPPPTGETHPLAPARQSYGNRRVIILRDYQETGLTDIRAAFGAGHRAPLYVGEQA